MELDKKGFINPADKIGKFWTIKVNIFISTNGSNLKGN